MSDGRRFVGGAGVGILLALAMVAVITFGTSTGGVTGPMAAKTGVVSDTTIASSSTTTHSPPAFTGAGASVQISNANASSTATTSSSSTGPPPQEQNSASPGAPTTTVFSIGGLTGTIPAVAIALVLGIIVYQISVRRVEAG